MMWVAAALLMLHWCAPSLAIGAIVPDWSRPANLQAAEHTQPFVHSAVGCQVAVKLPRPEKNNPSSVGKRGLAPAQGLEETDPYGSSQAFVSNDDGDKALRAFRAFDARGPPARA